METKDFERFMSKVLKTDSCWLWQGSLNKYGYANFYLKKNGKSFIAVGSRASWEHFNGPIPEGLCALHKCDVRNCVNPDHLFIGTKRDNWDDMIQKRRADGKGEIGPCIPNCKLSWKQAEQVRELYATGIFPQRQLAKCFEVSLSVIQDILNLKSYVKSTT